MPADSGPLKIDFHATLEMLLRAELRPNIGLSKFSACIRTLRSHSIYKRLFGMLGPLILTLRFRGALVMITKSVFFLNFGFYSTPDIRLLGIINISF